ncbi:MAG: dTMP kinase [Geminicoccales bacterium]
MAEPGRFITFEGGEGGGKSTQILRLAASLKEAGLDVVTTREPGGTEGAEAIRNLVTEGTTDRWSPLTETLLFLAAREDHVARLIRPALARGQWVLCDRFIDSTRVYQGIAGTLGLELIDRLHATIFDDLTPDLTLLLDVAVETGLARRRGTGEVNRFDQMQVDFHQTVRTGFLGLARSEPARFSVVDAGLAEAAVHNVIQHIVAERFGLPLGLT